MDKKRICIAEDHTILRAGLRALLASNPEVEIVAEAADGLELLSAVQKHHPDLVLLDLSMPKLHGLEAIQEISDGGAPMSPSVATKVLKMIYNQPAAPIKNDFHLTDREIGVLHCLVKGMSYKLIGDHLQISIDTVRAHIRNIYDKLQVNSKGEAIVKALKDNIV